MQSLWWMPIPIPVKKRPVKPTRLPPRPLPAPRPRDLSQTRDPRVQLGLCALPGVPGISPH